VEEVMSILLKSLVERIMHDSAFRKAFLAKPEAALGDQPISGSERRALIRAQRRLLLVGAGRNAGLVPIEFIPVEWP
jgi:hypothetical protein